MLAVSQIAPSRQMGLHEGVNVLLSRAVMLVWFCEGAIGQHRCGQPSAHPEEGGAIVNGAAVP